MFRSLLAGASNAGKNSRGLATALLQGKYHLPRTILTAASSPSDRLLSTAAYPPYEKPPSVERWEKLATKELSKSTKTVDTLRTDRVTPVRGVMVSLLFLFDKIDSHPSLSFISFISTLQ